MKLLPFRLIFLFLVVACQPQKEENSYQSTFPQQTVVMVDLFDTAHAFLTISEYKSTGLMVKDSMQTDNGEACLFKFEQQFPAIFALQDERGNRVIFPASPGDSIFIQSVAPGFRFFHLTGSGDSEATQQLNEATQLFLHTADSLAQISKKSINREDYTEIKLKLKAEYDKAKDSLRAFSLKLIRQHEGSLVSFLALKNRLGPGIGVFDPMEDLELYRQTDSLLYARFPDTEPIISFHEEVKNLLLRQKSSHKNFLERGNTTPDFELPSQTGNTISLSELKGQYVLLYFWASWCPPCRKQNPFLLSAYNRFHDYGFEIVQVSLDNSKDKWIAALEEDLSPWLQGSDLMGWDSPVVNHFGITTIPSNFLIGPKGTIIGKNLFNDSLLIKLEEIFNQ